MNLIDADELLDWCDQNSDMVMSDNNLSQSVMVDALYDKIEEMKQGMTLTLTEGKLNEHNRR